ncbi:hypothetical protein BDF21DRAFT_393916 [Thamnidium elegans]|nr:hypothetical protein BDF21DRAFT_393916 [Thamnidium elegans]
MNDQLLENNVFTSSYNQLFQAYHLKLIHSTYYEAKGADKSSLIRSPFHQAITDTVPSSTSYTLNFRQMRPDKAIVNKLLNGLLRYLLINHLALEHDKTFKEKKSKHHNKREGKQVRRVTSCSIPEALKREDPSSRTKGVVEKAERCQLRVDTYINVFKGEVKMLEFSPYKNECNSYFFLSLEKRPTLSTLNFFLDARYQRNKRTSLKTGYYA